MGIVPYTFWDRFTDADGTMLSLSHLSPDAVGWSEYAPPFVFQIQSNAVINVDTPPTGNEAVAAFAHRCLLTTPSFYVDWTAPGTGTGSVARLYYGIGPVNGNVTAYFSADTATQLIYTRLSVYGRPDVVGPTVPWVPGFPYRIGIEQGATSVSVVIDGGVIATQTNTGNVNRPVGFGTVNFQSQVTFDNWELRDAIEDGTTPVAATPRDEGGSAGRITAALQNGGTPLVPGGGSATLRDSGGSEGRGVALSAANQIALEVYFAGAGTVAGQAVAGVNYGTPTTFTLNNPQPGYEYILEAPAVDLAGWAAGVMGNNKFRRAGSGGNYAGPIVLRGIEIVYPELEA